VHTPPRRTPAFAGIAGAPIFAFFANRFGRKRVLIVGIILWSIASIGSGFTAGLAGLLLWRATTGFGEAAYNGLAPSWLADLYSAKWRNFVFSLFMLRNKVGYAIALWVGATVASRYDWHHAFFVAGIPGLLLAIGLLFVKEPRPGEADGGILRTLQPKSKDLLQVFRYPGYIAHAVALLVFFIAQAGLIWIPAYLHRVYGLTNKEAAGFFAGVQLYTLRVGLIGAYLAGLTLQKLRGGLAAAPALNEEIVNKFVQHWTSTSWTIKTASTAKRQSHLIVLAGPCGSGKSTLAASLAERYHIPWIEGDNLHSPASLTKMTNGEQLSSADRWAWLSKIKDAARVQFKMEACKPKPDNSQHHDNDVVIVFAV